MKNSIREILHKRRSAAVGGYSRKEYIREVCKYLKERYIEDIRDLSYMKEREEDHQKEDQEGEYKENHPKQKKRCLSAFNNYKETSKFSKASLLIIVPNTGLVLEIVKELKMISSTQAEQEYAYEGARISKLYGYCMEGDEDDEFLAGMSYSNGEFAEVPSHEAEIVIATTKYIVEMGGDKIDSSKHFFKTVEELEGFERRVKAEMGVYSFISGVDTVILLDAHILEIQNHKNLEETLCIVKEALPHKGKKMDIRHMSSGEEKKAFIFLMDILTPRILSILEKNKEAFDRYFSTSLFRSNLFTLPSMTKSLTIHAGRGKNSVVHALHHIRILSASEERLLVIVRDLLELNALKEEMHLSSLLGVTDILFIDEHMSRNAIKEGIKMQKRTWIVTERFIFYRQRRLHQLLHPLEPAHLFAPHVLHPITLVLAVKNPCKVSIICNRNEEHRVSSIIKREFEIEKEMKYTDYITVLDR